MKAAVLYETGQKLKVENVDVEGPKAGEVLVKMVAGGVCHSDLHVIHGDLPCTLPAVLGHEGAGIVEEVGAGVTNVKPGDHVIMLWRASCGDCYFCHIGRPAQCDWGVGIRWSGRLRDGTSRYQVGGQEVRHFAGISTFGEYSVAPAAGVMKIRPDVPLDKVAIVGCAVMTGVGSVFNAAELRPGTSAVVIGCGGVGLNTIQGCSIAGAEKIIAVDITDYKLELARNFGATHTLNGSQVDVVEAVKELTDGLGAHYAFEAIGNVKTLSQALDVVRRTGTVIAIGMPRPDAELAIKPTPFIMADKTLRGSLYGSCNFAVDVPRLLDLYVAGKLKLDEMISREYPIEQINEAFDALERGEVARSIVRFA
jgi:S-(hydroxymethyl)glutathione dehydrogenase / alcohol dehydrogenase